MKTKEHPIVEDYWIEELPNGVIHLLFNCNTRHFYHHQFDYDLYLITENETDDYDEKDIVRVPVKFLNHDDVFMYIVASCRDDEQLSYYFIPHQKEWVRNRKIIFNSRETNND